MATGRAWHGTAVLVLGGAGLLIAAGVELSSADDVDTPRGGDLADLVDRETQRVTELEEEVTGLAEEVDILGRTDATTPLRAALAAEEAQADAAGFTALEGAGVTVTLDDAPVPEDLGDLPPGTSADDFVVHQQDVEAVVNALWTGGAEGMQIMDRRITSVSAVRCVGNVIILDGQVYSPPFTITAVGNPARLTAALDLSTPVQIYREWAAYIGLGYGVTEHDSVELPAATGPTTLTHAQVAGGAT